jgi:hypothetical protein
VERKFGEALDVLEVAASVVVHARLWTRSVRAAYRESTKYEGHMRTCGPDHPKALKWSAVGALELAAPEPDGAAVLVALAELKEAGRGRSIMAVEDLEGHSGTVWAFAGAISRLKRKIRRKRVPRLSPQLSFLDEPVHYAAEFPEEPASSGTSATFFGEPVLCLVGRSAA